MSKHTPKSLPLKDRERAIAARIEQYATRSILNEIVGLHNECVGIAVAPSSAMSVADVVAEVQKIQARIEAMGPPFTGEIHGWDTLPRDAYFVATITTSKPRKEAIQECFAHVYASGPKPSNPLVKVIVCHPDMIAELQCVIENEKGKANAY